MGALTYYIAILYETIDNSKGKNPVPVSIENPENNRIKSIKENLINNDKFKNKGNKTTVKYTRFLSASSFKKKNDEVEWRREKVHGLFPLRRY